MAFHPNPRNSRAGLPSQNYLDAILQNSSFSSLTADKFMQIWKHYDTNKNNVLERRELNEFLTDLISSEKLIAGKQRLSRKVSSEDHATKMKILGALDRDRDGNISIEELAYALLPPEESLVLLFRLANYVGTAREFMQVWKKYDHNLSGFIEAQELKSFLFDLISRANKGTAPDSVRLNQYVQTIMEIYDSNHCGKLGLSDLARMLPSKENFVEQFLENALSLDRLYADDVITVLDKYDEDKNGTLEGRELTNLVSDLLSMLQKKGKGLFNESDVNELKQTLLNSCDLNNDGKIDRQELSVILLAMAQSKRRRGMG